MKRRSARRHKDNNFIVSDGSKEHGDYTVEDYEDFDGPTSGLDTEEISETEDVPESGTEEPVTTIDEMIKTPVQIIEEQTAVPEENEAPEAGEAAETEPSAAEEASPEFSGRTAEEILKEQFERAMAEKAEAERAEKEQQLLAKAEARKLLTQPVVQISADQKPVQQTVE